MDGIRWMNEQISPKSFLKLQEDAAKDLRRVERALVAYIHERFDVLVSSVMPSLRKIHALTEQIQRLDVAIQGLRDDSFQQRDLGSRSARPTTLHIDEVENRINERLDALLEAIDDLDRRNKNVLPKRMYGQASGASYVGHFASGLDSMN